MSNSGTITSLTNKGAINGGQGGSISFTYAFGGAGGVGVSNSGAIKTLINSGTITGGNGGSGYLGDLSVGAAGVENSGAIVTLTNSGTILRRKRRLRRRGRYARRGWRGDRECRHNHNAGQQRYDQRRRGRTLFWRRRRRGRVERKWSDNRLACQRDGRDDQWWKRRLSDCRRRGRRRRFERRRDHDADQQRDDQRRRRGPRRFFRRASRRRRGRVERVRGDHRFACERRQDQWREWRPWLHRRRGRFGDYEFRHDHRSDQQRKDRRRFRCGRLAAPRLAADRPSQAVPAARACRTPTRSTC